MKMRNPGWWIGAGVVLCLCVVAFAGVEAKYASEITVKEDVTFTSVPGATDNDVVLVHNAYNDASTYDADTTVPATKVAVFEQALTSGTATIDLTSMTGTNGATVDGTGLKPQLFKIRNKSTNAAVITIEIGASNGYTGFGASFSLTLGVGQTALITGNDAPADISGTVKTLDLTGTGVEILECLLVMG